MAYIDLHCHLLPAIDDGPATIGDTVSMLRLAHAGGTRALVATPHAFLPPHDSTDPLVARDAMLRLLDHLREIAAQEEHGFVREMTLYLGAENHISPEFFAALEQRSIVSLNQSRYLLVEFPPYMSFDIARSAAGRILGCGYVPVLAHVERYPFFQGGLSRLGRLREMGCLAQINASTVVQASGRMARWVGSLLDNDLAQIIASDGHGPNRRRPDLGGAAEVLRQDGREEGARRWMWENPARILANRAVE